jgi:hypothetical protein
MHQFRFYVPIPQKKVLNPYLNTSSNLNTTSSNKMIKYKVLCKTIKSKGKYVNTVEPL